MVVISIKDGIDSSNSNSPPEGLDTVRVKIFEHTFSLSDYVVVCYLK